MTPLIVFVLLTVSYANPWRNAVCEPASSGVPIIQPKKSNTSWIA